MYDISEVEKRKEYIKKAAERAKDFKEITAVYLHNGRFNITSVEHVDWKYDKVIAVVFPDKGYQTVSDKSYYITEGKHDWEL